MFYNVFIILSIKILNQQYCHSTCVLWLIVGFVYLKNSGQERAFPGSNLPVIW